MSQLFLDDFITFCKETTYFQAKVVLKIGRCQLFRWFSQPWGRVVSYRFRRPKGIISAPKTPNIQQVTHLPSYPLRGIYNPYRISKTEFFTRFAELVNTGQHIHVDQKYFCWKVDILSFLTHFLPCIYLKNSLRYILSNSGTWRGYDLISWHHSCFYR